VLRHALLLALRGFRRQPGYSAIAIGGLAVGLAVAILVSLFARHELSYDGFHAGADRIHRVVQDVSWAGGMTWDWTTPVLAPLLAEEFPQVEATAQFARTGAVLARPGVAPVFEEGLAFADANFLDLFAFELLEGDPSTALSAPLAVVLTETAARRFFGEAPAMGQTLRLDGAHDLTVSGVLADPPSNTHLEFSALASMASFRITQGQGWDESWWWPSLHTYVRLERGATAPSQEALAEFVARHREAHFAEAIIPRLQPVANIHLRDDPGAGAIRYVRIFTLIGALVLLLACVNVVNLTTARAASRAREVGVRKAAGAARSQLAAQFLGEAAVTTAAALVLGVALAAAAVPGFQALTDSELTLSLADPLAWAALLAFAPAVALLAGGYPAFVLARFRPEHVLKGVVGGASGGRLRRMLVVGQFAVTVALLIGAAAVYQQVDYLRSAPLGFETERVVTLPIRDGHDRFDAFKERLQAESLVAAVSAANWSPRTGQGAVYASTLAGTDLDQDPQVLHVDPDFFEVLGIEAAEGRLLEASRPGDRLSAGSGAFLLNATAVRLYELDQPIGAPLRLYAGEAGQVVYDRSGPVVGVVGDFHLASLRVPIQPTALALAESPEHLRHAYARLAPGDARAGLEAIRRVWTAVYPDLPFEAAFLDDTVGAMYRQEARFGRVIGALAALAVLVASLGLFGLAAYAAERRRKEVGIRKVLGARSRSLVGLLMREYVTLVAVAFVVGAPLAHWAVGRWLEAFPYRTDVGVGVFVAVGVLSLMIAMLTVAGQALRAATADPVKALRSE
jgi:putative ABC transport system permease protein